MTLGDKIKQRRKQLNLTQEDLASMINVSPQAVYKYEVGIVTNIPSDRIELLSKALNVSPGYLLGWTDENGRVSPQDERFPSPA